MNQSEFDDAMKRSEFRCKSLTCEYVWSSRDPRRPVRCPACNSKAVAKVTGEGLRRKMWKARFDLVSRSLTYREREVIKLRYGIGDGYTYTLRECGKIFKVTHARIHQIEAKALGKLAHPVRMDKLRKAGLLGQYAQLTLPEQMRHLIDRLKQIARHRV